MDFAEQNINIFSAYPNHTPRLFKNMWVWWTLRLSYLSFCLVSIDRQGINKQIFFPSFTERIFIQTRLSWRVCNQPIEALVIVSRVTRILQLTKKRV